MLPTLEPGLVRHRTARRAVAPATAARSASPPEAASTATAVPSAWPLGAITILPGRRDALDQPRACEVGVRLVGVQANPARQRHEHEGRYCSHMHV
jgi:hypothetical protein